MNVVLFCGKWFCKGLGFYEKDLGVIQKNGVSSKDVSLFNGICFCMRRIVVLFRGKLFCVCFEKEFGVIVIIYEKEFVVVF